MKLLDYLAASSIVLDLAGKDAESILRGLVGHLAQQGLVRDEEAIAEALLEREGLGSTGIGHGVAIPHARSKQVVHPALVFGRSAEPVDFSAIDGVPTQLFFLLVAPESGSVDHLHLLARIAKLVRQPAVRDGLLAAPDAESVLDVMRNHAG